MSFYQSVKKGAGLVLSTLLAATPLVSPLAAMAQSATPSTTFKDVAIDSYYAPAIANLASRNIMKGNDNNEFMPDVPISRADTVYALYQMAYAPAVMGGLTFQDVSTDDEFYNAVLWANQNGIVTGYDEERFGPQDNLTREQFAALLKRFNDYRNLTFLSLNFLGDFPDASLVSGYAKDSMQWVIANGIISGVDNTYIAPLNSTSRGQAAVILERYENTASDFFYDGTQSVEQYKLDLYCNQVIKRYGNDLATLFNWVVGNIRYVSGPMNLSVEQYAINGFEQRRGNCLNYAATFYELANYAGYPIRFVQGQVLYSSGNYGTHAWTLINEDGKEYVYDPEAQYELGRSYNFFRVDPNYPPISYVYPAGQQPLQGPVTVLKTELSLAERYEDGEILY